MPNEQCSVSFLCCSDDGMRPPPPPPPTDGNIIITGDDTIQPTNVTIPTAPLNATWPTPSGVNETEAIRICQKPIMMSPAFELCRNYTEASLKEITDSCVEDIQA